MVKQNLKTLLILKARNNEISTENLDTTKSIEDSEIFGISSLYKILSVIYQHLLFNKSHE
jgi:hypothetical protein